MIISPLVVDLQWVISAFGHAGPAGVSSGVSTMVFGRARVAGGQFRPPRPVVLSENDQKVRDQVVASLREHQGNVSAVARALDKDRKQIQRWIKRFGLDPGSYR